MLSGLGAIDKILVLARFVQGGFQHPEMLVSHDSPEAFGDGVERRCGPSQRH